MTDETKIELAAIGQNLARLTIMMANEPMTLRIELDRALRKYSKVADALDLPIGGLTRAEHDVLYGRRIAAMCNAQQAKAGL